MNDDELRDRVVEFRFDIDAQADELYGIMELVCTWDADDLDGAERCIVEAMRKAEEVARSAIKAVGVLDNLLHKVREAKEAENERTEA